MTDREFMYWLKGVLDPISVDLEDGTLDLIKDELDTLLTAHKKVSAVPPFGYSTALVDYDTTVIDEYIKTRTDKVVL